MTQRLQIFRPGNHTANSGETLSFTEADLQASAAAYDPSVHEAPIVVGHPKLDAPAYGWIKSLAFAENALEAEPADVDPDFAELVRTRRFSKISASFYLPDSKSNPKPGVLYLRHVGFLGAQPPAVKGLKAASFADAEEGIVEFADWDDLRIAGLFRRLREWIIGRFGLDEADKALPGFDVDGAQIAASQPDPDDADSTASGPSYAEDETVNEQQRQQQAELDRRQAELDRQKAEFAEREKRIKADEAKARRVEHASFVDTLIKGGKLLPAHREGCVAFMAAIDQAGVVEFGEGDKKQSVAGVDWFKTFVSSLPKAVEFNEVGHQGVDQDAAPAAVNFAAPDGVAVDRDLLEVHAKASAYMAKHQCSYIDAVRAVSQ